jgi:hypothetical protein
MLPRIDLLDIAALDRETDDRDAQAELPFRHEDAHVDQGKAEALADLVDAEEALVHRD